MEMRPIVVKKCISVERGDSHASHYLFASFFNVTRSSNWSVLPDHTRPTLEEEVLLDFG